MVTLFIDQWANTRISRMSDWHHSWNGSHYLSDELLISWDHPSMSVYRGTSSFISFVGLEKLAICFFPKCLSHKVFKHTPKFPATAQESGMDHTSGPFSSKQNVWACVLPEVLISVWISFTTAPQGCPREGLSYYSCGACICELSSGLLPRKWSIVHTSWGEKCMLGHRRHFYQEQE